MGNCNRNRLLVLCDRPMSARYYIKKLGIMCICQAKHLQLYYNLYQSFFQGGGEEHLPPWLWLAPLEILFHVSSGKKQFFCMALSSKCYDFGIKHPIVSGGLRPQTPCFRDIASLYSDSLFQDTLPEEGRHVHVSCRLCTG